MLRWVLLALLASQLLLAALTIALLRRVRAVEALTRRGRAPGIGAGSRAARRFSTGFR
jgi:hypothetical protein